jgi:hypothetical protein
LALQGRNRELLDFSMRDFLVLRSSAALLYLFKNEFYLKMNFISEEDSRLVE